MKAAVAARPSNESGVSGGAREPEQAIHTSHLRPDVGTDHSRTKGYRAATREAMSKHRSLQGSTISCIRVNSLADVGAFRTLHSSQRPGLPRP